MSEKTITIQAPAKINLSLRILGKRSDGYHEVDTLMTKVKGLYDILELKSAEHFSFHCSAVGVPDNESNLVVRATRIFEKLSKRECVAELRLHKNIPHGAGLGGGSSNAAACLRAWNQWHDNILSERELLSAAASLGSDVPFFLGSDTARCRGRGEFLEPAADPRCCPIVIFKPAFAVSTADAYARFQGAYDLPGVSYAPVVFPWGEMVNNMEKPVIGKFVFLAELKNFLTSRPEVHAAMMSGSGSAMFALLANAADAESLIQMSRDRLDPLMWAWSGEIGA
jgi:4-diphosphocytidyl-2-C-methyl-D-erythritol kinase